MPKLKPNDILAGKYKILTMIGKGGMSRVWLAMDTGLNKQWAVKEIDKTTPEYRMSVNENQTLTEIELMKGMDHSALPRIVEIIDMKESLCVIMDYIEGESLLKILDLYGPQPQELAAGWMMDICGVLDYLHSQTPPIIYRDMKPSNIMLRPDGTVKVIDFGIAREYKEGKDDTVCLGTKGYASPEHFLGKTDVRSDIYTVGVTMYQLLTGKNPAEPPYEVLPIREIDPLLSTGLEKIIMKATASDPQDRYQSAGQMRDALANYHKLEEPYIRGLKKRLDNFKRMAITSVVMILISAGMYLGNMIAENNTYEELLARENPDVSIRFEELKRAITLKPARSDAYIRLIKEYSKDSFTEKEASSFLSIYNANKNRLERDDEEYRKLNFEIGQAFLLYYTGSSDGSERNRLIIASPFFKSCAGGNDKESILARAYYEIAEFYQDYIIGRSSLVINEAGKNDYRKMLDDCKKIMDNLSDYRGEGDQQMKLVSFNLMLGLFEDIRQGYCRAGLPAESLVEIPRKIKEEADRQTADIEITEQLRKKVIKRADDVISRIKLTYDNERKKERGKE